MRLTLNIVSGPEGAVLEQRRSGGAEIAIGRGPDCDWVLHDPDRVLSKRHCVLEFLPGPGGGWQARDTSTNGTFLNRADQPIGRDATAPLSDHDRLRLGGYEIEVRIEADRAVPAEPPRWEAAPPHDPWGEAPPHGLTQSQHGPGFSDAMHLPGMRPAAPLPEDWRFDLDPPGGGDAAEAPSPFAEAPGGGLIPDDWDPLGELAAGPLPAAPARPRAEGSRRPGPPPAAPVLPEPRPPSPEAAARDAAAPSFAADPAAPFAEPGDLDPVPATAAAPVVADARHAMPPPRSAPPSAPPASPGPAAPADRTEGPGDAAAALEALLRGAGLSRGAVAPGSLAAADPLAALERAGVALRAAIGGLRALLIARADVKREFRIEQTMLRLQDNNPVKFAATEDAALLALLGDALAGGAARGTPADGAAAIAETVADLIAHQVASLAATQAAARALLARLAPEAVEAAAGAGGGGPGLFGGRDRRLWDAYRRLHGQVSDQFDDDFDSAFGKEFARAYERATARPPRR